MTTTPQTRRKKKVCPRCKARKYLAEFGKHKETTDGHQSYCKRCIADLAKVWRKENRIYVREKAQAYRAENGEKLRADYKRWYLENRVELLNRLRAKRLAARALTRRKPIG